VAVDDRRYGSSVNETGWKYVAVNDRRYGSSVNETGWGYVAVNDRRYGLSVIGTGSDDPTSRRGDHRSPQKVTFPTG